MQPHPRPLQRKKGYYMESIAQDQVSISTEGAELSRASVEGFDALRAYKDDFFVRFGELISRIVDIRQNARLGEDTQTDWIEIKSRLELLHHHVDIKVLPKMEV